MADVTPPPGPVPIDTSPDPPAAVSLPPTGVSSVLVRDPVRISFAVYGFIQAVISVLLLASVISEVAGGIITGVALALYGLATQLFVSPQTVPRQPLEELAAAAATRAPPR